MPRLGLLGDHKHIEGRDSTGEEDGDIQTQESRPLQQESITISFTFTSERHCVTVVKNIETTFTFTSEPVGTLPSPLCALLRGNAPLLWLDTAR